MNNALYNGESGVMAYQHGIDIISHNISNSNTTGYKVTKAEFKELLYNKMDVKYNLEATDEEIIASGHGVKLHGSDLIYSQGNLQNTGYDYDFAIVGDGLFAVDNGGQIEYTKNGNFDVSIEQNGGYLVSSDDGSYILDQNRQRIVVPFNEEEQAFDTKNLKNVLGVFNVQNPYGLLRINDTRFLPTDKSGIPVLSNVGTYDVYEKTLEASNINLAKEMSDVIVYQRSYQFCARVVSVADEVEQVANSLRK